MSYRSARTLAGGSLAAVLLLASACGGGGSDKPGATSPTEAPGGTAAATGLVKGLPVCAPLTGGEPPASKDFPASSDPARNIPVDQRNKVNVVLAGVDFYVGDTSVVFGITDKKDEPQGGATTRVTLYDVKDANNPKPYCQGVALQSAPGVGKATQVTHASGESHTHGGEEDGRVGYYIRVNLPRGGVWGLAVEAILRDGTKATTNVAMPVAEKPAVPSPGQSALKSDNLTKKDVKNIAEIDSGVPPNDMHDVKIKDAIAAGRPMVIVFSTPAYCVSRFCGPVTEEVEELQPAYKDRVDFIHIEIYRDFQKELFNPTALEWLRRPNGNVSEPYVYIVDKNGVIYDRFEGPAAKNIIEPSIKAVAGGATFK